MGKISYYITKHSATGVYGYKLSHNQTVLFRNGNIVLPNPQPVISTEIQTGRQLITYPIPSKEHPTIVPGLRIRYDCYDGEIKTNLSIVKVYNDFRDAYIIVSRNGEILFKLYPQSDGIFMSPDSEPIGLVENDLTFKYDPCSLDEKRYIFQIDDSNKELLPYMFHAFILFKLKVL